MKTQHSTKSNHGIKRSHQTLRQYRTMLLFELTSLKAEMENDKPISGEWINVNDIMPDGRCLLLTASNLIVIGDRYKNIWRVDGATHWDNGILKSDYDNEDVTHWMRLPKSEMENDKSECKRCKKMEFMIDNGLGWEDMRNDITLPHEI